MTVPFGNIPANLRVPLFYAEVDNSQANSGAQTQRALIIGQITASGTAVVNVPVLGQGVNDAKAKGGQGSMLALMTAAYKGSDNFGELWFLPLADASGAVAATGTLQVTGTPTATGVISLYVGGQLVSLIVATSEAAADIAAGLAALINSSPDLPVTAAASTSTVTFTAKNKGLAGNEIDLRLNYLGTAGGESVPAGLTLAITQMAGGATNPVLDDALANLGDEAFDVIVSPYTDTASLNALKTLLNDRTGRWSYASQIYGHVFAAQRGTLSTLATAGNARNNQHETIMGVYDSPSPAWIWAADMAGAAAVSLRADPGRPLQTLALSTVLAPPAASRFDLGERNTLLWDGISTFTVASDGAVAIENLITTYQKNSFGAADDSYLQVETLFLLMFVLRAQRTLVTSKYSRVKLAANGTRFAPGSAIVTPNMIRADLIAQYGQLEYSGFVQDASAFAKELIVEKNSTNSNRVDVLWPGTLINQLRIFALLAQFRL
ncbi:phage tail sheath subtilisin-like domain-containing protein [Pseudomonas chlororaphis]|uniref:phage tail sheath subtilisin-like domain-containing protein n=1 Tax=Pseudomonas chlororaphis TaxID=587753 RepID=UPI00209BAACB|nr:phage tail sheath subtilisin-like domain-containing protein [Pseudomonas chlororaphis]MCO7569370.1 phage tail sheath subtilisin-like domain-containing protein [Pseudomonas chlororaphis]MCO7586785.1 phage tail sheath subtilisin-like domain-containing protein [Pseudomonas chlororaphis]